MDRRQCPHEVPFTNGERRAVAVDNAVATRRADPVAGGDNPSQVQWIRGADGDETPIRRDTSDLSQTLDGLWQCKLLTGHAGDEPAAADLAARFKPPVDPRQLAPRRG